MPPGQSNKMETLREEAGENELPYISKSRVKTWLTCKRKFYFKYILGHRTSDSYHLTKGRRIHQALEEAYEDAMPVADDGFYPDLPSCLPGGDGFRLWSKWRQHIVNWIGWEVDRMKEAGSPEVWSPVGVEVELWMDDPPIKGCPPMMGFADLIVEAESVPEVDSDEGVVIIDFKTGSTPDKQYREKGIYLESTYYALMFEKQYDRKVAGVAGYYPQSDTFLVAPESEERRALVWRTIKQIINADPEDPSDFAKDEQPLCAWGSADDECCDFYQGPDEMGPVMAELDEGECDSTWGTPSGVGPNYFEA